MQKFHLVPRCLYLAEREAAVVEGLRCPRWRTAAKSEGFVRLSGQALVRWMLLERRPRRVTIVLELALRLSLVASLDLPYL